MTDPLNLAAEEAAHVELRGYCADAACDCPWPCPTSTLIRVVRKQNEALVRAQDHLAYVSERDEAWQVEQARAVVAALVDLGEPT